MGESDTHGQSRGDDAGLWPHHVGHSVPVQTNSVIWAFVAAGAALVVLVGALGIVLSVYQHRFVSMYRSYSDGLVAAQEQERAWVAREVHDDALQRIRLLMQELDDWTAANGDGPPIEERTLALRTE